MKNKRNVFEWMDTLGCIPDKSADNSRMSRVYLNCSLNNSLSNYNILNENDGEKDKNLSEQIKQMIASDECWVINDYNSFVDSLSQNDKKAFLTPYTRQELEDNKIETFQLKGYKIGFALHKLDDGNVDIISVHNSETNIGGVVNALLDAAKRHGGNQLDHFDGKLSEFYQSNGFEEYDRWLWDDQYAPKDWDYEKYGRPDVVLRRLKK